jgi:predicted nuclease of predicted toxin-antitoxin system
LRQNGIDATHVVGLGLATATDSEIFDRAVQERYVVVTSDSDFPMLLALRRASNPSVIHLRRAGELAPEQHAALLIAILAAVAEDLEVGSVVSLSPTSSSVGGSTTCWQHLRTPRSAQAVNTSTLQLMPAARLNRASAVSKVHPRASASAT